MKKLATIFLISVIFVSLGVVQAADIEFSPGGNSPGHWFYDGSNTFSFSQDIDIDSVQSSNSDALYNQFVYLPDMILNNYTPGDIAGTGVGQIQGGTVEIRDSSNNVLLSGELANGIYVATFGTSSIFPKIDLDVEVESVDNSVGSDYLNNISIGDYFDFNLSLQSSENFDTMIQDNETGSNGFSGSMTIPEPTTIALLGLGGLLIRRKKGVNV